MASTDIQDTRQLFLWLMGCMYMLAFGSLYVQIPGLYGPNGLTPIYNVIPTNNDNSSILDRLMEPNPSIVLFSQDLKMPPHIVMELCCIVGALLGLLVMVSRVFRTADIFVLLWALYLSVYKVGQVFMHFQWDILLLEAGFLTSLVAPINYRFWRKPVPRAHDGAALWLVRWLLFRLMFASGIVKIASMCPTWWGLTALNWHYESQCIPTPLAWYAHQLPEWFQKLSVVGTYFIEIGVPFLFFVPVRSLRLFAFWNQVFFQVCIILTGNYNFFNLLTITLCVSLLDDRALSWLPGWRRKIKLPVDWSRKLVSYVCSRYTAMIYATGKLMVFVGVVSGMVAATVYMFKVVVDIDSLSIHCSTGFTPEQFNKAVSYAVPVAAGIGAASLALELLYALWESISQRGTIWKMWSVLQTIVGGAFIIAMFGLSLVSHGALDSSFSQSLPSAIHEAHDFVDSLSITSSYGLFRRMTGVGGRPELIIEGTNDVEKGDWREYDFLYKPGRIDEAPSFVAPHQPRLDWQMWFAALGTYQYNPWLVNLVYKLLIGQREVMDLLAPPPFATPPKSIRVQLYHYHYTEYDNNTSLLTQSGPWWRRELQQEYLFPLTQDHSGLEDFLKKNNFNNVPTPSCLLPICSPLEQLRLYSHTLPPTHLLLALFSTALLVNCTTVIVSWLFGGSETKKKKNKNAGKPQDKVSTNQSQSSSSSGTASTAKAQAGSEQGGGSKRRKKKNKEKREE